METIEFNGTKYDIKTNFKECAEQIDFVFTEIYANADASAAVGDLDANTADQVAEFFDNYENVETQIELDVDNDGVTMDNVWCVRVTNLKNDNTELFNALLDFRAAQSAQYNVSITIEFPDGTEFRDVVEFDGQLYIKNDIDGGYDAIGTMQELLK